MFERLLERIAGALDRTGIPYMVIGGQAVRSGGSEVSPHYRSVNRIPEKNDPLF
jgi:hypothetical protein